MTIHIELPAVGRLYQALRLRHARTVDHLGFGYSRDLDQPAPIPVPDGVDLYFFTGRTRQEATR